MKSLSTTDTSIRLCLEQMSCRDKGGYKQNNTSAGSHPSIWLWYQDEKHENGATGRPHVKTSPIWYGIEVRQFSNGFSVDFMKGIPYQSYIKNKTKLALSDDQKRTPKRKNGKMWWICIHLIRKPISTCHVKFLKVPCTTVNLSTYIRQNKRKIPSICEMNQPKVKEY